MSPVAAMNWWNCWFEPREFNNVACGNFYSWNNFNCSNFATHKVSTVEATATITDAFAMKNVDSSIIKSQDV